MKEREGQETKGESFCKEVSRRRSILVTAAGGIGLAVLALVGCRGEVEEGSSPTPIVTQSATPETPTATATPEWFDYYPGIPGRNYFAPGKEIHKNPDPTGTFYIDELAVGFRPGFPEERIAEILVEKNLDVKAYYGNTNAFLLEVDPEQRDDTLSELKSHPEIERASRSDIFEGTNEY